MRDGLRAALLGLLVIAGLGACGAGDKHNGEEDSYSSVTAAAEKLEGFFDMYWNAESGRLLLHVREFDTPFLYVSSLARGVGSNDLGLDRGQLGDTRVSRFRRTGPRVLLVQDNTVYQAHTDDAAERLAVEQSFAFSVLGGFDVVAEDGNGGALIDVTDYVVQDIHGVAASLKASGEGVYKAAPKLSSVYLPRTRGFPDNTEIEAVVTLSGEPEGEFLPTVVPDPTRVSVHMHHSFVRLPDAGYEPVPFDPRSGYMSPQFTSYFQDYASPIGEPLRRAWLSRHRLAKRDPAAAVSEAVEPIVYYLDRGVPEPMRSALLEGARWWNQAFEAAGYKDAFQVKILPEDADPMDVRYNVIQWVHRSTRGWSYGSSVRDPRTGEIIKGHVTLGSLRVRQDYLLAEGLLAPYGENDRSDEVEAFALARLRQLSAHEVGHTLGLDHNFAASVNERASVMDYPHPLIKLDRAGGVDVSDAYAVGMGEWDKRAILYGYQDFPAGVDTAAARAGILEQTMASDLHLVVGVHSRGVGDAHPLGSLWDNGANAIDELNRLKTVRRVVLDNFSDAVIRQGTPYAQLEDTLVPVYLLHRYQLQAAGKFIGGQYFTYALRGDGQQPLTEVVPVNEQRRALDALLETLFPDFLTLDPTLVKLVPPRPPGYPATRELFPRSTGGVFDPVAAAEASVALTLDVLLNPERAARMNRLRSVNPGQPSYSLVLDTLLESSWLRPLDDVEQEVLQRAINNQVLLALMRLSVAPDATLEVRGQAMYTLQIIAGLPSPVRANDDWRAHFEAARRLIEKHLESGPGEAGAPVQPPPGSPIG